MKKARVEQIHTRTWKKNEVAEDEGVRPGDEDCERISSEFACVETFGRKNQLSSMNE